MKKTLIPLLIFAACAKLALAQEEHCIEQKNPKSDSICYGISTILELDSAIAHFGEIEGYWWEQSHSLDGTWQMAEGENTQIHYTTPPLTENRYYRRVAYAECGNYKDTIWSDPALITVLPQFFAGEIETAEIIVDGEPVTVTVKDIKPASGGEINYRWKMDNQVIEGKEASLEIDTKSLAYGTYLFTREAKDNLCAGGWIASEGYCKINIKETHPPQPCNLNPNSIVAKTDISGTPYLLIYPNPDRALQYQWYKEDEPIKNENEQFYYPADGKLKTNAKYKVEIWEEHDPNCKNFTEVYNFSKNKNTQDGFFTVMPNPVTDNCFKISFNQDLLQNKNTSGLLKIYSSFGEKIWEMKIDDLNDVTVSKQMQKGLYIITLILDNKHFSEKLIIQ